MSTEPLYSLIYTSQTVLPFSTRELDQLLEQCRQRNRSRHITGMLVHLAGSFMQVLEGSERAVTNMFYGHIVLDPRHTNIDVASEGPIGERQFSGWAMAFENVGEPRGARPEGFSDFVRKGFTSELRSHDPTLPVMLLGRFRQLLSPQAAPVLSS